MHKAIQLAAAGFRPLCRLRLPAANHPA
jgi:hypothetical protein